MYGAMGGLMKDSEWMARCLGKELTTISLGSSIRGIFQLIRNMDLECLFGEAGRSMKETDSMGSNMDLERLDKLMVLSKKESEIMESQ